ncbi:MFS transporter, partial [Janthinobacterium sp. HH103]|uniref:MFS transporter n=1 Tax=Janthinobacterium sp. HH103 TaxID=1537275 RepID=UPI0031F65039
MYGWRSAFIAAAAVGGLTLLFQLFTLPRMAPRTMTRTTSVLRLLRRPGIGIGMLGCVLAHTGQYALFTYIRPALESVVHIDVNGLSLMLLGFGVANFVGTLLAGWLMERSLRATLVLMPALAGLAALGKILLPVQGTGLMFLVALWGLALWSWRKLVAAFAQQATAAAFQLPAEFDARLVPDEIHPQHL